MVRKNRRKKLDQLPTPKDPFVCPKKGINPTIRFFGDGIGTIKPTRIGKGMDP